MVDQERIHGGQADRAIGFRGPQTQLAAQENQGQNGRNRRDRRQEPRPGQGFVSEEHQEFQQVAKERRMDRIGGGPGAQGPPAEARQKDAKSLIAIESVRGKTP